MVTWSESSTCGFIVSCVACFGGASRAFSAENSIVQCGYVICLIRHDGIHAFICTYYALHFFDVPFNVSAFASNKKINHKLAVPWSVQYPF